MAHSAKPASTTLLILHQGALGDFILTLSIIQPLARALNARDVITVSPSASARLSAGRSVITRHHSPDTVGLHTLFGRKAEASSRLLTLLRDSDTVLSFLGGGKSDIHTRLREVTPARILSVDPRPDEQTIHTPRHITQQWFEAIRDQGIDLSGPEPPAVRLRRSASSGAVGEGGDAPSPDPLVIIHPGSGGRKKCWPGERFFRLADALKACREGSRIAWMLGPVEMETRPDLSEAIHNRTDTCPDHREAVIIEADLHRAAKHLARAGLYIGNDSGITHLAAALGLTTIAIFTSTSPGIWRPLGDHVHAFTDDCDISRLSELV